MNQEKEIMVDLQETPAVSDPPSYKSIIVDQPKTTTVVHIYVNETDRCPKCRVAFLEYDEITSANQHAWFFCLLFACCILSWLPYVMQSCAFKRGKCKNCGFMTTENRNTIRIVILYMLGVIFAFIMMLRVFLLFTDTSEN